MERKRFYHSCNTSIVHPTTGYSSQKTEKGKNKKERKMIKRFDRTLRQPAGSPPHGSLHTSETPQSGNDAFNYEAIQV